MESFSFYRAAPLLSVAPASRSVAFDLELAKECDAFDPNQSFHKA